MGPPSFNGGRSFGFSSLGLLKRNFNGASVFQRRKGYGVDVIVLKDAEKKEFEEEMVEDIIALVTSYSARIYGKRGGRKKND